MKEGWLYCEIQKHIRLIDYRGRTPIKTESGIKLITAKNVKLGYLQNHPEEFIAEDNYEEWMRRGIPNYGDVIFTTEAPLANVAQLLTTEKVAFAQRTIVMQPNQEILDQTFLKYTLLSPQTRSDIFSNETGATVTGIKSSLLKKIKIPIPPIQEQKQIVAILDEAFAAIDQAKANIEKNIANSKELFQSKLNEIFSQKGDDWEEKKLGEVCSYDKTQGNYKDLPYVGLEDIESNTGVFLAEKTPRNVKSSTFKFDETHVLYGRLRPYLNKALVPDFQGHCSTEIFPIKPSKEIDRKFLFYWLTSEKTMKLIDATWTGARMPRANMNQVLEFNFSYPPLKNQISISESLDILRENIRLLQLSYSRKLEAIDELKGSILQKAFAGELTYKS